MQTRNLILPIALFGCFLTADATIPPTLSYVTSSQHLIALSLTAGSESVSGFDVVYQQTDNPVNQCKDYYRADLPQCIRFQIQPWQSIYLAIGAIAFTDQFCETTTCPGPRVGHLPCGTTFSIQAIFYDGEVSNVLSATTQPCND